MLCLRKVVELEDDHDPCRPAVWLASNTDFFIGAVSLRRAYMILAMDAALGEFTKVIRVKLTSLAAQSERLLEARGAVCLPED
jgi:hypothetical protein